MSVSPGSVNSLRNSLNTNVPFSDAKLSFELSGTAFLFGPPTLAAPIASRPRGEFEAMPMMQKGVAALSDRMPKVISPKAHAIADYITMGGLVVMGMLLWKNNKRASIAALTCAGAEAANTLLTEFPGGIAKAISFPAHSKIDMGLAAMCSAMPNFMRFEDEPEAKFFRIMGLNITTVAALTDFRQPRARKPRLRRIA